LVIGGSIAPADVPGLCKRVRILLDASDADLVVCDVSAIVDPDVCTVDALARLQLTARRLGRRMRLHRASTEVQRLVAFAGLADALPLSAGLRLGRAWGQAEEGEQPLRVEERVEADDPAV
jgi:ABC-type transporter Mla MlaB component